MEKQKKVNLVQKNHKTCEFPCKQVKEMTGGAEEVERMH